MLIVVSGTCFSPTDIIIKALSTVFEFEVLDSNDDHEKILEYATLNYERHLVMECTNLSLLNKIEKRPYVVHISMDCPISTRIAYAKRTDSSITTDGIVNRMDEKDFDPEAIELRERANIKFKIRDNDLENLETRILNALETKLKIFHKPPLITQQKDAKETNAPPLRPTWDTYFMKLATLAASRSNCMKRRVGCVIVREKRVIATGYNGTPRHLMNCFDGGCPRCNGAESSNLNTCLCLHAEENALLEAGRDRVGSNATLYCDTCPCLTCSVKIVQTGIKEVVYSQSYRMDSASSQVLKAGGVHVRQFSFLDEPHLVMI